ncbi:hypothetical protein GGR37_001722 [Novosphingobium taihuense]|uniref:Uncharacterized protein n=1 Tax=Novosphingobium taihuense TaxID=260085 RepID=A0A7W7AAS9_9SPHN|nr:hypothetical protein [Novosphingobium taihuense]
MKGFKMLGHMSGAGLAVLPMSRLVPGHAKGDAFHA